MKFNDIIIGSGLSGMTAAINLANAGHRVAIVAGGGNSTMFNTGSFGLLNHENDLHQALSALPADHPYSIIGVDNISQLTQQAESLLKSAGLDFYGDSPANHERLTPVGHTAQAWLTLKNLVTVDALKRLHDKHITIVGIDGFLDFYSRFIAAYLVKLGLKTTIVSVGTETLRKARKSETEMRAHNISRILHGDALQELANAVREVADKEDSSSMILFPAVIGAICPDDYANFIELIGRPALYAPTFGPSVPGIMIDNLLRRHLNRLGVTIFKGDMVVDGHFIGNQLTSITTKNLGEDSLEADNYIYAAGSFFGRGLTMTRNGAVDSIFGLDTKMPCARTEAFADGLLQPQPFMKAGLAVDADLHALRGGVSVKNVSVVGAALSGADSITEGSGAGVALLSALHVSNSIIK